MNISEIIKNAVGNPSTGSVAAALPAIIKAVEDAMAGERKVSAPVAPKPVEEKRVVDVAEKR